MSNRVVVVEVSSSEDEAMESAASGGGGGGGGGEDSVKTSTIDEDTNDVDREKNESNETPTSESATKVGHRYDREEMLKLYNHPSAKIRPSILSPDFDVVVENGEGDNSDSIPNNNNKLWSPDLWIQSIWNPEPKNVNQSNWMGRREGEQPMNKKKQTDRLKAENEDGIVLSPQRRSFGAGCQVAASSASTNVVGGSQGAAVVVGSTTGNAVLRRSASPVNSNNSGSNVGGGDDRQPSQVQNTRSSFRGRGGGGGSVVVNAPVSQHVSHVQNNIAGGGGPGSGRGDRVENWRDRTNYGSANFGRQYSAREAPNSVNSYARSRGGGQNSWNAGGGGGGGGGRRSYGPGGGYHHDDSLPEWVTEGPADMFETMELRGFDEEERDEMQMEQNGMGQRRGPARVQQTRSMTGYEFNNYDNGKEQSMMRRSNERNEQQQQQQPKRISNMEHSSRKSGESDKMVKISAEALVDGFDIGDMTQFLSVAGADFDSIANGDMKMSEKQQPVPKVAPTTPTVASRFSKFFNQNGGGTHGPAEQKKQSPGGGQKQQQPQSVNIMDLFSKAAVAGDAAHVKPIVSVGAVPLPASAKSLDEIEAAYKSDQAQKMGAERGTRGSPNKVLQELFQSARTVPVAGAVMASNLESSNFDSADKQQKAINLAEQMKQIPPGVINAMINSSAKGNPLADPAQQQQLLDSLRKIQQVQSQGHPHGDAAMNRLPNELSNPFLAAYPQLAGLQHLLQQQHQAMQMGNLQMGANAVGRVPSPGGNVPGVVPSSPHPSAQGQAINPAFAGFLPPANVPPPPITQQDLLMAHSQSIYQRAMMGRKMQGGGIEDQQPSPKPSVLQHPTSGGGGKLPNAFLPTSVIKQMHSGGGKPSKDDDMAMGGGARPIVKQQQPFAGGQQEQISPNSLNEQLMRLQQQQNVGKSMMAGGNQQQPMAPPPSMTPQDLQRLIDQSQRQQRQHQERVLLEQYAKVQQQQQAAAQGGGNGPMNPATVQAALALQNNPVFVQMLRAQAMQQQMAMAMQQQAAAAAAAAANSGGGGGLSQASPQPIPASAAVSAMPNAAQLVRGRMGGPPPPNSAAAAAASNPELLRHLFQQQQQQQQQQFQQQQLLNQLRQHAPNADANMLNRILTGASTGPQHPMGAAGGPPQSYGNMQFPAQSMVDGKPPLTLEELERLHKQSAAMQQPQS